MKNGLTLGLALSFALLPALALADLAPLPGQPGYGQPYHGPRNLPPGVQPIAWPPPGAVPVAPPFQPPPAPAQPADAPVQTPQTPPAPQDAPTPAPQAAPVPQDAPTPAPLVAPAPQDAPAQRVIPTTSIEVDRHHDLLMTLMGLFVGLSLAIGAFMFLFFSKQKASHS